MSENKKEDIRELIKAVQSDLPEAEDSSIMNETTVITNLNESAFVQDHKSLVVCVILLVICSCHREIQQMSMSQS